MSTFAEVTGTDSYPLVQQIMVDSWTHAEVTWLIHSAFAAVTGMIHATFAAVTGMIHTAFAAVTGMIHAAFAAVTGMIHVLFCWKYMTSSHLFLMK